MPFVQTHLTKEEFRLFKLLALAKGMTLKDLLVSIINEAVKAVPQTIPPQGD